MSDPKDSPTAYLFVFDKRGNRRQLRPTDLGAGHEEELGEKINGIGLPPPTEMIPLVPRQQLRTDVEVIAYANEEKQALHWQLRLFLGAVRVTTMTMSRAAWARATPYVDRVMAKLGETIARLQDRLRSHREIAEWGDDETVVLRDLYDPEAPTRIARPDSIW